MADFRILIEQRDKLLAENDRLLRGIASDVGVDADAIESDPRPGSVVQDPLLNEVYDLQEFNRLLHAIRSRLGETPSESGTIEQLDGVGPDLAAKLRGQGFDTIEKIANAEVQELTAVPGVGEAKAKQLKEAANAEK